MKNILPINTMPIITSYTHHSAIFSILNIEDIEYNSWFASEYIQLVVSNDYKMAANLDFYCGTHVIDTCPFISSEHITWDALQVQGSDTSIIDYLVEFINNGYYVYIVVDGYYISNYSNFKKRKFGHPLFIYGYDKGDSSFFAADFFNEDGYKHTKISFDELSSSLDSVKRYNYWWSGAKLIKKRCPMYFIDDYPKIYSMLNCYYESSNSSLYYRGDHIIYTKKSLYGINVYERLVTDLKNTLYNETSIFDFRAFPILLDHKKTMVEIMKYLLKKDLVHDSKYLNDFVTIQSSCEILRNIILKYRITKQKRLLEKAIYYLENIREYERRTLHELLLNFKDKVKSYNEKNYMLPYPSVNV
ncbi:hypothetical protein [Paenibacillus gorillae]|uniref:hypothetical protein n=1 Tax=Paenibacillus gorillae TaxID=1243662 RepID=UPI0004B722CF|nr:hypothetical protein [Paenibacillus gorillae]